MSSNDEWIQFKGGEGPGSGKHIVLVSGDEEYRSEEAMPMLAKVLSTHHGFDCTVLFAVHPETGEIDPQCQTNIPGLHRLDSADLMILLLRFRELPDEQMVHIIDYVNSGRPVIGMRTATHAFKYTRNPDSPYAKYDCKSESFEGGFGRQVLGETWINHHGHHGHESTRGVPNPEMADHPILKGVEDVWGPTDVYGITKLSGDSQVILHGQVLTGMDPKDDPKPDTSMMPVAWIKTYTGDENQTSRIFCTTMGAAPDLKNEGLRRLLVNAASWCVGLEPDTDRSVEPVGAFDPTYFGFKTHKQGLRPSDYR